MGINHTTIS